MKNIFRKRIRQAKAQEADKKVFSNNASKKQKSKIGSENQQPHSPLSRNSFSLAVQCFQLKRDIDKMLDLQWMKENYGGEEEQRCLSKMEVRNMSEFLERLQNDDVDSSGPHEGKNQSRHRIYELVDRRKALYPVEKRKD